jgi:ribosome-binding protein aMBF1 (putative translation factor)
VLGEINPNTTKPSGQLKIPCVLTFPLLIKTLITIVKEIPAYKMEVPKDLTPEICAEIVRLLTEVRKKKGLSQNALAVKAKINQSLLSGLEKEPWNPTIGTLLRIADGLEIDLGEIITRAHQAVVKPLKKQS